MTASVTHTPVGPPIVASTTSAPARRRIATRGALSLMDQAASSAATFLTGAIVGRTCPKAQFGLFALSLTVLAWVTNMQSAFVTTPYLYSSAALDADARRAYAGSTLLAQGVYSVFATMVLLGAAWVVTRGLGPSAFAPILTALAAMLWFLLVKEYGRQIAFAHLRVTSALWLDTAVGVLQIGGLLALASVGQMTAARAYWVIGVASAIPSLCWLAANRHAFRFHTAAIRPAMRRSWNFGKWLPGGYVMNAASRDTYQWLVTAFRGAAATGTLAASTSVAFLATPVVTGISNVLAPTLANTYSTGGVAALRRLVARMTMIGVAGIGCYCLVLFMLGGRIATLIYGKGYAGDGAVVALLALSVAATVASLPIGMALYTVQRADVNFRAARAAVAVAIVAGVALVRAFGVVGAALGLVCGTTAESLYKWYRYDAVLRAAAERREASEAV